MPMGFMIWGAAAGLVGGGLAMSAGFGAVWAGVSYMIVGAAAATLCAWAPLRA